MRILLTGANGFIGKNAALRLNELPEVQVIPFVRGDTDCELERAVQSVDAVLHLAGENRPSNPEAYEEVNVGLTRRLCDALRLAGNRAPVIFASSAQAVLDNPYGRSKQLAERAIEALSEVHGNPVVIYRLPGVFGKWCKPNYNSVVATFCHNIANDLPIKINDPNAHVRLVYIDDVIKSFISAVQSPGQGVQHAQVDPEYSITLGDLSRQLEAFKNCRTSLVSERVGAGIVRALYATYVSHLPPEKFSYDLPAHRDARGVFVEFLKTIDSGQFSYFTAHPGITRGGHYHHTKTEKFLVIKGRAKFGFRHMITGERFSIEVVDHKPQIVETVPGWTHDITNVGSDVMVVMLWANEMFDRGAPDTIACKV